LSSHGIAGNGFLDKMILIYYDINLQDVEDEKHAKKTAATV